MLLVLVEEFSANRLEFNTASSFVEFNAEHGDAGAAACHWSCVSKMGGHANCIILRVDIAN